MLEGYKVSMEARLKQGCAKLHAFNKRISFASSRMELLQGSSQQRSCRHMCDAVRVVNFQDSKFGAWVWGPRLFQLYEIRFTQYCAAIIATSCTLTSQISLRYFGSSVWHWFAIFESGTHLCVLPVLFCIEFHFVLCMYVVLKIHLMWIKIPWGWPLPFWDRCSRNLPQLSFSANFSVRTVLHWNVQLMSVCICCC